MIDGKPYKALRRHLNNHGLTADEYRQRYNLNYPMVAVNYSTQRGTIAKKAGLGRNAGAAKPVAKAKATNGHGRKAKSV